MIINEIDKNGISFFEYFCFWKLFYFNHFIAHVFCSGCGNYFYLPSSRLNIAQIFLLSLNLLLYFDLMIFYAWIKKADPCKSWRECTAFWLFCFQISEWTDWFYIHKNLNFRYSKRQLVVCLKFKISYGFFILLMAEMTSPTTYIKEL